MTLFEKEAFSQFLHEGTYVVNNVLKRNILKLKFLTLPEELKDEIVRKEEKPSVTLSRISKPARGGKWKSKSSQSVIGSATPRKSVSAKSKFNIFSTAIQWMASRPDSENVDLVLAEKLMKASESNAVMKKNSATGNSRGVRTDFKVSQAKRKLFSASGPSPERESCAIVITPCNPSPTFVLTNHSLGKRARCDTFSTAYVVTLSFFFSLLLTTRKICQK